MCGLKPTTKNSSKFLGSFSAIAVAAAFALPAQAQVEGVLEEIVVTATKREESLQDVPVSVAILQDDRLNVLFSGSEDVLALSGRVPGLYAESSNGRAAPRFYMRGLGNIDFDLAASQPVSFIMDEVVMENVVLKSFPLFDVANVEAIRGPQGTLFGRNTTAGIVKINTRRPTDETDGYFKASWGTFNTVNVESALGGAISDTLRARGSVLYRQRDNWIRNGNEGFAKTMGDYEEIAARFQLEWDMGDSATALLSLQTRSLEGTSSIFRANVFSTGSNSLNQNYDREVVYYDGGDNNPQSYDSDGITLNINWELANSTFTSITSWQQGEGTSRGDIDGGVVNIGTTPTPPTGLTFADTSVLCPFPCLPARTWPGEILVPSVTEDGADVTQFTQEFRLASNSDGAVNWQVGAFYFSDDLEVETDSFASFGFVDVQNTIRKHTNDTWAVFGQVGWDISDTFNMTAGVRYTDDKKDFAVLQFGQLWLDLGIPTFLADPINVSDGQTSWDLSANWAITDHSTVFARYSNGFRAQTIQGRDVAFLETPSTANAETIDSFEIGYKADLMDGRARVNLALFNYTVDDLQLSIIGGASNANVVINSDEGEAWGYELDTDFLITDNFMVSFGYAYNHTELNDSDLSAAGCGSGLCTLLDPADPANPGRVLLDGNPFPRVPKNTMNISARFSQPIGNDAEFYVFGDYVNYGRINMPLYEAVEFVTDNQYETGVRFGYKNFEKGFDLAIFGRNVTDTHNVLGFIDFSNNTGFVNEPATWGLEFALDFGD